jgi:hypothetical protein
VARKQNHYSKREKLAKQTAQKIGLSNLIIVDAENIFKNMLLNILLTN